MGVKMLVFAGAKVGRKYWKSINFTGKFNYFREKCRIRLCGRLACCWMK
jgi:hypothetical protein